MNSSEYTERYFGTVEGWLDTHAVHATGALLDAQRRLGVAGCNLEIGVFQGLYLGALMALAPERRTVGLDVWLFNDQQVAEQFVRSVEPAGPCKLFAANSYDLDPERLRAMLDGEPVAFASVDGLHTHAGVRHDLLLVAPCLSRGGIIALDDFLSPLDLGVTEAAVEVVRSTELEPICYSRNKLYLTTTSWASLYTHLLRMWLGSHGEGGRLFQGAAVNETTLCGKPLITF